MTSFGCHSWCSFVFYTKSGSARPGAHRLSFPPLYTCFNIISEGRTSKSKTTVSLTLTMVSETQTMVRDPKPWFGMAKTGFLYAKHCFDYPNHCFPTRTELFWGNMVWPTQTMVSAAQTMLWDPLTMVSQNNSVPVRKQWGEKPWLG